MSESPRRGVQALAIVALLITLGGAVFLASTRPGHGSGQSGGLVEDYLKSRANDPSSVTVQSIVYTRPEMQDGVSSQMARVKYREKNQFGAMVFRDTILRIDNGRDVSHGPFERDFIAIAHTVEWFPTPAGRR